MNEYESCKTDRMTIFSAEVANELDGLTLNEVIAAWSEVIRVYVAEYALDNNIADIEWIEEHPLNIIMLDKVAELMGLELRENSIVDVNNAYDWLANVNFYSKLRRI